MVCAVEHREIHNFLSVRRVTTQEDPLIHEGLPGSRRVSIDIPSLAWELTRQKDNSATSQRERWLKEKDPLVHEQTQHNESVLGKVVGFVIHNGGGHTQRTKT